MPRQRFDIESTRIRHGDGIVSTPGFVAVEHDPARREPGRTPPTGQGRSGFRTQGPTPMSLMKKLVWLGPPSPSPVPARPVPARPAKQARLVWPVWSARPVLQAWPAKLAQPASLATSGQAGLVGFRTAWPAWLAWQARVARLDWLARALVPDPSFRSVLSHEHRSPQSKAPGARGAKLQEHEEQSPHAFALDALRRRSFGDNGEGGLVPGSDVRVSQQVGQVCFF